MITGNVEWILQEKNVYVRFMSNCLLLAQFLFQPAHDV